MMPGEATGAGIETQRLDKWLWYVRVVKTRTLAATLVTGGKVRVNRARVDKPSQLVRPGDVLTIAVHTRVRVLKVVAAGDHRGSPKEAVALFEDLTPPEPPRSAVPPPPGERTPGSGRPTKRERRRLDKLIGGE